MVKAITGLSLKHFRPISGSGMNQIAQTPRGNQSLMGIIGVGTEHQVLSPFAVRPAGVGHPAIPIRSPDTPSSSPSIVCSCTIGSSVSTTRQVRWWRTSSGRLS